MTLNEEVKNLVDEFSNKYLSVGGTYVKADVLIWLACKIADLAAAQRKEGIIEGEKNAKFYKQSFIDSVRKEGKKEGMRKAFAVAKECVQLERSRFNGDGLNGRREDLYHEAADAMIFALQAKETELLGSDSGV